jgi:hypothetical protein
MISDMIDLVDSDIARGAKRTEASAARLLSLSAMPTFAIMALLTAVHGGSMPDMLCSAARDASPLTGMVPMYVLMSAFHLAPWLRLISSRRHDQPFSCRCGGHRRGDTQRPLHGGDDDRQRQPHGPCPTS